MNAVHKILAAILITALAAGCSSNKKLLEQQQMEITSLTTRLNEAEQQLAEEQARAANLTAELDQVLAEFSEKEELYLEQINSKTVITLPDAVLFSSGSARLTSSGKGILDRIAGVLEEHPDREILVEGHTDDVQIANQYLSKYPSNWELSSARAHSVLHYFQDQHRFPGKRLSAIGYGEYRPLTGSDTPEGRAMNRRVVISIGPMRQEERQTLP
ncbi:MAG: OmpA family protein [Candidatus Eisenbacteria bacterium]|uniref:OmpA family protein n=1 Tax=Eiseniibacteriota bacterium TaxID=2212470 RepID=A0A948W6J1_UNCEI|nr:OmpA family protein [Candidatus Eisenbacteria bacterium]MBU1949740.1 OmpA family protein [Candidatus Eisenbacteria bacterium]MBU2691569.1 OmpA family protein [Candidatus Eisenbacteria bacterium]